jgi:hypothetical protein
VAWRHVRDLEGRQFADATNKKAGEFYTPRSVVRLRVNVLDPRAGESIYDPTCGTGGMLLSCIAHLRNQKKEWRNVKLYGQERNPSIPLYVGGKRRRRRMLPPRQRPRRCRMLSRHGWKARAMSVIRCTLSSPFPRNEQ